MCRSREHSKEEHYSIRCSARIRDDNPTGHEVIIIILVIMMNGMASIDRNGSL